MSINLFIVLINQNFLTNLDVENEFNSKTVNDSVSINYNDIYVDWRLNSTCLNGGQFVKKHVYFNIICIFNKNVIF